MPTCELGKAPVGSSILIKIYCIIFPKSEEVLIRCYLIEYNIGALQLEKERKI